MSKKQVQDGRFMNWTNGTGADVISGELVLVGSIVAVAQVDIKIGESGIVDTEKVHRLPKVTADVVAQGVKLYRRPSDGVLTTTSTGNNLAGVAFAAATGTDTEVSIKLNLKS